jgi:glyoxylase-like metal-dependent hydrolase (beta-lactamase superfamily II)
MLSKKAVVIGEYRITTITGDYERENCFLVGHIPSGEQVVIDPGNHSDVIKQVAAKGGTRLRNVLLTHAHYDHVGAVAILCRDYGIPCDVHKDDARLLRQAPVYALRFAKRRIELPGPARLFDGKHMFSFGERTIQVVHTPGHTPGSVCYSFSGFAFTGDTLMHQLVGSTDLPGGDVATLSLSIDRLLESLPDDTILFPGHGVPWTLKEAKVWWQGRSTTDPDEKIKTQGA